MNNIFNLNHLENLVESSLHNNLLRIGLSEPEVHRVLLLSRDGTLEKRIASELLLRLGSITGIG